MMDAPPDSCAGALIRRDSKGEIYDRLTGMPRLWMMERVEHYQRGVEFEVSHMLLAQ